MRAVTFGTATRDLGGLRPRLVPSSLYQINSPPINSQCTNFVLYDVGLYNIQPFDSKGLEEPKRNVIF